MPVSAVVVSRVLLSEELERGPRLGLLFAENVDSAACQEDPRFGSNGERVCRSTLGRKFEYSCSVGIVPELGNEPAAVLNRLELELEHCDRPEHREFVQLQTVRCVGREE